MSMQTYSFNSRYMKTLTLLSFSCLLLAVACRKDSGPVEPGNDPNFTIVANEDGILKRYNRKVVVFGIDIYAVADVTDDKLLHAANLMAQYLDNNEDGIPDNQAVVDAMLENKAYMVMWKRRRDLLSMARDRTGQDLGNDETHPSYITDGKSGTFDAALEEVLHIITHAGYAHAYPDVFGEDKDSKIAKAMDLARGGYHSSIPKSYPGEAWYTYTDKTCDYSCQVTEYHYWALTSLLGAQENRLNEIEQEWKLNTPEKLEETDKAAFELLTDPTYGFPTALTDGSYMH